MTLMGASCGRVGRRDPLVEDPTKRDDAQGPAGNLVIMSTSSRPPILPWALWDAGTASFNAVMTTFVFTVYLTSEAFGDADHASLVLSLGMVVAAAVIVATAPVVGQRLDRAGSRRRSLALNTFGTVLCVAACFFVRPEPAYLYLGVGLIAVANVFAELATVHYNSLLPVISTPQTVGRVGGLGWSMGYFGGILALGIVLVGFVTPGLLGIPEEDSLNIRAVALFSAVWMVALSLPILVRFPQEEVRQLAAHPGQKDSIAESYRRLGRTLKRLWREEPVAFRFFIASAVFRDGLGGIFTFGGVLAAGSFGFSFNEVILFAIAGNIIAGLGAVLGGRLDDAVGPQRVIVGSLIGLLAAATPLLFLQESWLFWVCGLLLCAFVGPAQSASRSYLSRLTAPGTEGEYFGLYSTTGRAMSFLAPAAFAATVWAFGGQIWGIVGIMAVLLAGLVLAARLPNITGAPEREETT